MRTKKLLTFSLPALFVIILDQASKYIIRTTTAFHNWDIIPGVLSFNYTLNPGMALGMNRIYLPFIGVNIPIPTLAVSIISVIATIGIACYVLYTMKGASLGYLFCMGLIVGGAIGNIIDRLVMGIIGGYGPVLAGHVVDFIHFTPRIKGYPVFPYIFNVADAAITIAICILLIFNRRILPRKEEPDNVSDAQVMPETHQAE